MSNCLRIQQINYIHKNSVLLLPLNLTKQDGHKKTYVIAHNIYVLLLQSEKKKMDHDDLPRGPLDIYRKKASFNWKDMCYFLEEEEIRAFKVLLCIKRCLLFGICKFLIMCTMPLVLTVFMVVFIKTLQHGNCAYGLIYIYLYIYVCI